MESYRKYYTQADPTETTRRQAARSDAKGREERRERGSWMVMGMLQWGREAELRRSPCKMAR